MAASKTLTPEQRVNRARNAYITGAARSVIRDFDKLPDELKAGIRSVACKS